MKHWSVSDMDGLLESQLQTLGLEVNDARRACILRYLVALLEANRAVNLTRITETDDAIRLHVVDSLSALPELLRSPAGPALDLGTGGGFPGVPLSIAGEREFVLLDSVAKKGAAVSSVLSSLACLNAPVDVQAGRAEEFALVRPGAFAVVLARAVAPLPALVELAAPLLKNGGHLVALKGCPESSERASGSEVARIVGMVEESVREFALPGGGEARTIVTYTKNRASTIKLPRRTGLAQHNPLA